MSKPALVSLFLLAAVACNRRDPSPAAASAASTAAPAPSSAAPAADPAPSAPSPSREPLVLVSGRSLGAVRLGMSTSELRALGPLQETARRVDQVSYTLGPYALTVRDDQVTQVAVTVVRHAPGVQVGALRVRADTPTEAVTAALPGCGPVELNRGGAVAVCDEGRTRVMRVGPPGELVIEVLRP